MSNVTTPKRDQSQFVNIAAYKFTSINNLPERKAKLLTLCRSLNLRGTILLSSEGINLFLAGSRERIDDFLNHLRQQAEFENLEVKESFSDHQPFSRMLVRLKKEIISMGVPDVCPQIKTSPKIAAKQLKEWLDQGKDIALLDVRNDYEYEIGSFENAIRLPIDHFRDFPSSIDTISDELKEKPIVMFCTGGIRCEKAGPLMEAKGFKDIYQLEGGILKYFEECGGDHYRGDCFVFDKRVALDSKLTETGLAQCYHCQAILSIRDQQLELYEPPRTCHHCHPHALPLEKRLEQRAQILRAATTPLPGDVPYLNSRPTSVTAKFDQQPLIEFLISLHADLDRNHWIKSCAEGRVRYRDRPLEPDQIVRAGWQLHHLVPDTVEPEVSNAVEFLFEDKNLIAINKPAPLPMHPCGRFNKNTLQNFLRLSYPHETIRILHRLDAETTGVLILGRERVTTARLHQQFATGKVRKTYLARVLGHPVEDAFECCARISGKATGLGGVRLIIEASVEINSKPAAKPAITQFEVLRRNEDSTSLIKCTPITGRTNQIRVHLAHLGFPIIGDTGYGSDTVIESSSLSVTLHSDSTVNRESFERGIASNCDPRLSHSSSLNLHAYELEFEYPPKHEMRLTAEPPIWTRL